MSPALKSKTKDKLAARAAKEQLKASLMSSGPANSGNGIPGSAYNPVSGTFHSLETAPSASAPAQQTSLRFRTIDETTEDISGSSQGTGVELDSLSNNGGSGSSSDDESEGQKEKGTTAISLRTEPIPGSDVDKREKIRQKNEKKHQRQREKRAQELHERCNNFFMSRKLDGLAQKLVAMGFPYEHATVALMDNEGRVEDSVSWLLEREEHKEQSSTTLDEAKLKIDIADELARLEALKNKYKCTKQEVEKILVAYEGDFEKAETTLRAQRQEQAAAAAAPSKVEPSRDPLPSAVATELSNRPFLPLQSPAVRAHAKGAILAPVSVLQQSRDDRDFNYTKVAAAATNTQMEPTNRKIQMKPDFGRLQAAVPASEKRWASAAVASTPSVSYPPPLPPLQGAKVEARYQVVGGNPEAATKTTSMQAGGAMLKEPIIMMQRPQSSNGIKQQSLTIPNTNPFGSSLPPSSTTEFHPNSSTSTSIEMMKLAAVEQLHNLRMNGSFQQQYHHRHHQQFHPEFHYQPLGSIATETEVWGGRRTWRSSENLARRLALATPLSLGLFSGSGLGPGSSDWSMGWLMMNNCDYTKVDWSMDSTALLRSSRPVIDRFAGIQERNPVPELQIPPPVGYHEWTSLFNGDDLFSAPRRFVTPPSQ